LADRNICPTRHLARKHVIVGRLINSCWFLFRGAAVLAVAAVGVGIWFYLTRFDETIRSTVQQRLEQNYPHLLVTVRAAQRVEGEGILVRGISLAEHHADGPVAELLSIDEMLLGCATDLPDLLSGDLPLHHVRLRRMTLRATRRPDGTWSSARLLPLPCSNHKPPTITIEDGTLEVFDPQREASASYSLRQVHLTIRPEEANMASGGPTFAAQRRPPTVDAALPPGTATAEKESTPACPPAFEFEGSFAGDFLRRAELQGRFDPATQRAVVGGRVEQVEIGPELVAALPPETAARVGPVASLRCGVDLSFRADYDPSRAEACLFDVDGTLSRGKMEDPRLPLPLSDVTGRLHIDNRGFRIEQATARSGLTTLSLSCRGEGLSASSPVVLRAEARRFLLDRQLAAKLPDQWQAVWYKFLPAGEIHWRLALDFDGQRWAPKMEVDCVDVSFTHHKFPYRVERATGALTLADDRMHVRLRGYGDGRPIDIEGQFDHPGPDSTGAVTVSTMQMPLSSRLLDALPGKSQAIVKSLEPQGTINCLVRMWRATPEEKWRHQIGVELNRISLKYQRFPYPLKEVRGRLDAVDGQWQFRELVGLNSNGYVTCGGSFTQNADAGELLLRFDGADVALSEDLHSALPPSMQALWTRIKPRGNVDLTSQLRYTSADRKLDVSVHVEAGGEGLIIEPDFFPYRMEKLRGAIDYQSGQATLRGLRAEHGRTRISTDGQCQLAADGSWTMRLDNLAVDQLEVDRDLLAALPPGLRSRLSDIQIDGPLAMRGALAFRRSGLPIPLLTSTWDLEFTTVQGQVRSGIDLKNIAGGIRVLGEFDGTRQQSRGWIDLDSVQHGPYQLTEVRGPFRLGDDQLLLGSWSEQPVPNQPPRRLTAKLYGGAAAADVRVTTEGTPQFTLQANLDGCDLTRFLMETSRTTSQLRGLVAANLELSGSAAGTHRLQGSGNVQLRDGDIYELPLLLSLLKILSNRNPDKKAFSASDIAFKIRGDHAYFESINFYGDAISLLGEGEMDFEKNVRMTFHPIVGSERQIPVLKPLLGMAGQQLMLLKVEGPLESPRVTKEALPAVRQAVEQIQGKTDEPPKSFPLLRSASGMLESMVPGK